MIRYIFANTGVLVVTLLLVLVAGPIATANASAVFLQSATTTTATSRDAVRVAPSAPLRLAQGRDCASRCGAQCRSATQGCSGSSCSAQYQICVRQCVVACGGR